MRKNFGAKPFLYPQPVMILGTYLIWNIEVSVMWKRYVWEREPKEKERRNLI